MTVITISRQYGSGGDEIAAKVCDLLGYQMFNKDMICQAAAETGISEQEIVDYSEENYKVRSFLDRLLNRGKPVIHGRVWTADETGPRCSEIVMSEETVLSLVQQAIHSAYRAGNMIIVGRGGMMVLKGMPGVLHVRIEAPMENRIQYVKGIIQENGRYFYADIESRREAQDRINERDEASAGYIRQFYSEDWRNPLLYHLALNTGILTTDQAVHIIERASTVFEQEELAVPFG
jgi:CMP/dCMP kinase